MEMPAPCHIFDLLLILVLRSCDWKHIALYSACLSLGIILETTGAMPEMNTH